MASTTIIAKPRLVWETEKAYARYYVPVDALHSDIRRKTEQSGTTDDSSSARVSVDIVQSVDASDGGSKAVLEKLTVGDARSTTWVRFTEGPLKDLIRFERDEIGECGTCRLFPI